MSDNAGYTFLVLVLGAEASIARTSVEIAVYLYSDIISRREATVGMAYACTASMWRRLFDPSGESRLIRLERTADSLICVPLGIQLLGEVRLMSDIPLQEARPSPSLHLALL